MKKNCIIFVPGFKGSALSHPDGKRRIWITLSEILFGKRSLELNHGHRKNDNQLPHLVADGILEAIPLVPGIFQVDIYKSFLKFLKFNLPNISVIPFSYDWRNDIIDSVQQLHQLVEQLKEQYTITIVAHSMGGLITAYYLRYGTMQPEEAVENWEGTNIINSVVFAGVPFMGIAQVFVEMQTGSIAGINKLLLSPEAMSSFPSAYQMLPSSATDFFLHDMKKRGQIFSLEPWIKYNWGPFNRNGMIQNDIDHYSKFLVSQLHRASFIHELLQTPSQKFLKNNLQILNCIGHGQKTIIDIEICESNDINFTPIFDDGDGTVPTGSADLPPAFKESFVNENLSIQHNHRNLYNNNLFRERLLSFIRKNHNE